MSVVKDNFGAHVGFACDKCSATVTVKQHAIPGGDMDGWYELPGQRALPFDQRKHWCPRCLRAAHPDPSKAPGVVHNRIARP